MTPVEARLRAWFARRTPVIKMLAFIILAGLAWTLPPMIAFSNPAEAVFLGRYDRLYFLALSGYVVLVLGWAGSSIWMALRLDMKRLELSQEWVRHHALSVLSILGMATLLVWILVVGIAWQVQALPGDIYARLRVALPVGLTLFSLGIVTGWGDALQAGIKNSGGLRWTTLTHNHTYWLVIAGLLILSSWLLLQRGLLTTALIKDASAHLYIGQHLLRGGIPYQTAIYFHPPLRFLVSGMWALPGAAGLPIVESARVLYGLTVLGVVWAVYGIGKQLSSSISGGVIAAGLMLHTPFITTAVFEGPNLKIAVALALTVSIWLAQREKWFWAGVISAAGIGLWLPAVGGAIGIGLTALMIGDGRWQAIRKTALGGLIVIGLVVGWMLATGTLDAFFRQSILAALIVAGGESSGRLAALWRDILALPELLNGWIFAAAAGIGFALVIVNGSHSKEVRANWLTPVVVLLMLFLVLSQDVLLGLDFFALGGLLAGFATVAVLRVANLTPSPTVGRRTAAGLVVLSLVAMGMVTTLSGKFDREPKPLSLTEQQQMASELSASLIPDDTVQAFDLMWFMVLANHDNSLPVIQARPKGRVANAEAGWPEAIILDELERIAPAVVMLETGSQVDMSQLEGSYLYAGSFDVSTIRPQQVYIRLDRQEIQMALGDWPEANP